jgi:hypothetical protein
MQQGLKFEAYADPLNTGWIGWIENPKGNVVAFIKLDGRIITDWEEQ